MANYMAEAGFGYLPVTEHMSSAGLTAAMEAASKFDLLPLFGQKIPCEQEFLLAFPDDIKAFAWLNRLISELLEKVSSSSEKDSVSKKIFEQITKCIPAGKGRLIINSETPEKILLFFIEAGWKIYGNVAGSQNLKKIEKLKSLREKFGIRLIVASDISVTNQQEFTVMKLLEAISSGNLLETGDLANGFSPVKFNYEGQFDEAFATSIEFAKHPSFVPEIGKLAMPSFSDDPETSKKLLKQKCEAALVKKFEKIDEKIKQRFDYELETIMNLGFADYFLVVEEITSMAKKLGVRVLGRGSAANSLISYILDFTQVDPLKYNLYFERFLNCHRKSPPDIDLDFSWKIRDQIYQFLLNRWGREKVAMISTHISLNSRSAVRETGKALGVNGEELDYLSSLLGHSSLQDFIKDPVAFSRYHPDMGRLQQHMPMLRLAAQIEGLPTHFSIHAGGVVIAPNSIFNFSIIQPSSKVLPITQLEMRACENLGLVKFDLLSQRALGVYADASLALQGQIPSDPEIIEKDEAVRRKLEIGDTLGVFYIESPGMRGLLGKLSCKSFSELIAASSIIRPGVAESGMMQEYIRRHLNPRDYRPVHPLLGEILEETYGIMVYQEDVMKVAHCLAGFSLAEADVLRRAMSGKERSQNQMESARQRFLAGAAEKGIEPAIAGEIWRQISSFCGYAFCKAHSAAYAVLSLELLWLKTHHPLIFYQAVINNRGGFYGTQAYISAAMREGIKILPPDITQSEAEFTIVESHLLTGLSFISNLEKATVESILRQRKIREFAGLSDFIERIRPSEDEFNSLVGSGSLDRFGNRAWCRWQFKTSHRAGLFVEDMAPLPPTMNLCNKGPAIIKEELQTMGFAVSDHPCCLIQATLENSTTIPRRLNKKVEVAGLLLVAKSVTTSKGGKMKFLTLEDGYGLMEIVFFPDAWKNNSISLEHAGFFKVKGTVKCDQGQLVIQGEKLTRL
ncbi:MAG: DNA polymerase III subunit alpha [Candidatus Rifleibacteriota bacterium]